MIAMMLPSAAPMVLLHAAVTRKGLARADDAELNAPSHRLLSATTAFSGGYLVMWGAFSLVAVVAQWALERGELLSAMMSTSSFLGSGLLLAAGLWQLTLDPTPHGAARIQHVSPPRVEREYRFSSVMLLSVQRPLYFGGERSGSARRVPHVTPNVH